MEILNNFSSIYCFIAFIIGAVFMLVALAIAAMGKDYEPRNNVRFFVTRGNLGGHPLVLWLGKPIWNEVKEEWEMPFRYVQCICSAPYFYRYNLNPDNFADMKNGEIREVFINLED